MRKSTARKILNVQGWKAFSSPELSRQYSLLARNADNLEELILISSAYIKLQKNIPQLYEDLSARLRIQRELKGYFRNVEEEYSSYVNDLKQDLQSSINATIDRTRRTSELKRVVRHDVANKLRSMSINLSEYLQHLDQNITLDKRYSIENIFYPMYKDRQAKWLRSFYKSRIFISEVVVLIVTTTLSHLAEIYTVFPRFEHYLSTHFPEFASWLSNVSAGITVFFWNLFLGSLGLALSMMIVRYFSLGPKWQLITPRFSIQGIRELVSEEAGKIQFTDKDIAKGGVLASILLIPIEPVVTAVIAVVTGLIALIFGKSFDETKREAKERIWGRIRDGFNEINHCVKRWLRISERAAYNAMMKSVVKNCNRLSGHLINSRAKKQYIQVESSY